MNLLNRLSKSEKLAKGSKINRFFASPYKYLQAQFYNKISYPLNQKSILVSTSIFTGDAMELLIPAGMDIYLTAAKSHDSEIRLCKYFIQNIKAENTFFDIGAHFGFYALLASKLVGNTGKVFAFEAAKSIFKVLNKNCNQHKNITPFNKAVSNQKGEINFYEFPIQYSEYNSVDIEQYMGYKWFKKQTPSINTTQSINLDSFIEEQSCHPNFIKIDVEGAEELVIKGATNCLTKYKPIIAMEFLLDGRGNQNHLKAAEIILNLGYSLFTINENGNLVTSSIDQILSSSTKSNQSDNIVFKVI